MAISIEVMPGVGAEILGVDIAGGLASSELETIKQTFSQHGLVFFRNQKISEADHIGLGESVRRHQRQSVLCRES